MFDHGLFATAAQVQDNVQPNLFPFPFPFHLVFCIISLIFFLYQFRREKKPYQAIMAFAIPFSLLLWLYDNKGFFYMIGIVELICFVAAFISLFIFKDKKDDKSDLKEETPDTGGESGKNEKEKDREDGDGQK